MRKIVVGLLLVMSLVGCSSTADMYINAAQNLNQDQSRQSLPVQVRIYQLSDKNAFSQATFRDLWQQDSSVLGNSLLEKREITVNPNSTSKVAIKLQDDCHYIGVVAIFRKPNGDNWRAVYQIPSGLTVFDLKIKVHLTDNSVVIVQN